MTPRPTSPQSKKPFIANSSELHSPLNPQGIIDANFLILVRALGTGDDPENVRQALYDWLGSLPPKRRVSPEGVDRMLELGPEGAFQAVVQQIGGGLSAESLPATAKSTLKRAIAHIAQMYVRRQGGEVSRQISKLRNMKRSFQAESIVRALLY